jgi:arginyl-tRNA synthetase
VLFTKLTDELQEGVRNAAQEFFNVSLDTIPTEIPPRAELGDVAFPVAFDLARRLKQATGEKHNPRQLAEQMARRLSGARGVARVEIAGAGYLNVFFDRAWFLAQLANEPATDPQPPPDAPKRMVEHTSINPNKAAHIGHVRNAVLGDTFVRMLRAAGERVEVQNYIDNTGVQVADVVVAFIHLEGQTLDEIKALDDALPPAYPFDFYCWDLYTKVGVWYRDGDLSGPLNKEKEQLRKETLHLIEEGDNPTAELAEYVATRNVVCILRTMERLGIQYDLLPRESEILRLKFWQHAFEQMKAKGVIHYETEGKSAGCWVMPLELHEGSDEHNADKILVRSNGTVTYTGKDIAYQLWKLGRLDLDFYYQPFYQYPDGHCAYVTTDKHSNQTLTLSDADNSPFGHGATVYNVIDTRQSYPQRVVKLGVAAIAPEAGESASVHLAYEMVALSQAAAEQLGFVLSNEDRTRSFIEMSGRKGLGVKADDLLNQLIASSLSEVAQRHPALSNEEKSSIARLLAIGALRYFLLKFTRNSVIVFDFKEALAFEGETGTYCQNAAVRINSIFRKMDALTHEAARNLMLRAQTDETLSVALTNLLNRPENQDIWELISLAARLDETLRVALNTTEPALLAKYAFQLAKSFNLFYHHHRILQETEATRQAMLVTVAQIVGRQLTKVLGLLGIQVPERM